MAGRVVPSQPLVVAEVVVVLEPQAVSVVLRLVHWEKMAVRQAGLVLWVLPVWTWPVDRVVVEVWLVTRLV